jgi:hypothetical protein
MNLHQPFRRLLRTLAAASRAGIVAAVCAALSNCAYDFDAAFEGDTGGSDASTQDVAQDTGSSGDVLAEASDDAPAEVADDVAVDQFDQIAPEECLNGLDDDGDGLVDCADSDCAPGYACVPAPPSGWGSPAFVSDEVTSGPPPPCGTEHFPSLLKDNLSATPMSCNCDCAPAQPGQCSFTSMRVFTTSGCTGGGVELTPGCNDVDVGTYPFVMGEVSLSPGDCSPTVEASNQSPPFWSSAIGVCEAVAVGAGCVDGQVCAPRPTADYHPDACVHKSGDVACPAAFPFKHRYSEGTIVDDRACSATGCSCGDPAESCPTNLGAFADPSCGTPTGNVHLDGSCDSLPVATSSLSRPTGSIPAYLSGGCEPNGAATVTGSVTDGAPHTVCCKAASSR